MEQAYIYYKNEQNPIWDYPLTFQRIPQSGEYIHLDVNHVVIVTDVYHLWQDELPCVAIVVEQIES